MGGGHAANHPRCLRGLALASALAVGELACGGGAPLLYPARALGAGDVRVSGGTSGSLAVGSLASDVASARSEASEPGVGRAIPARDATYAKGALVLASVAPGMAPYAAGRVGVGSRFEAGLTYTGRAGHVDIRRSFDWNDVSLSIGLGAEVPIYGDPDTSTLPQVDLASVRGYGVDVPVLVGWRSVASAYMVWVGARVGWDHVDIGSVATADDAPAAALSANRFFGGGVAGLAGGFRHVHVALELDVAYDAVDGTFDGAHVTVQGVSLAPAGAMWWTF